MKYRLELTIDKPRSEVWQAFNDPEKLRDWQPALTDMEPVSGIPGRVGAESKLTFQENQREFSLIERIIHCQEPESIHQVYENPFAVNTVKNTFMDQEDDRTLWSTETEYKFKTLLMKLMGPLSKKNFAARTKRDMERFKEMMEGN